MKKKEGELVVVSLDVLALLKDFSGKHGSCGKSALKLQRFEVKYHHRANLSFHMSLTKLMGLLLDGKWTALQLTLLRPTVGDPRVVFRKGKCIAKE